MVEDYTSRLEAAMKAAAVDVSTLARHLGVTYQAVKKVMERRTNFLRADNSAKAAAFLGVDPYWLATGEDAPHSAADAFTPELQAKLAQASPDDLRRLENMLRAALDMGPLPPKG